MVEQRRIESGEWEHWETMEDYRAEWLTDVLVERATWCEDAAGRPISLELNEPDVVKPGYVWTRFWFRREGQVVEKYFADDGRALGYYIPVCTPLVQHGDRLTVDSLGLALWVENDGRVTVLGEPAFEAALEDGSITPVVEEQAEQRIRELTTLIAQRYFPPALVRNFSIVTGNSL